MQISLWPWWALKGACLLWVLLGATCIALMMFTKYEPPDIILLGGSITFCCLGAAMFAICNIWILKRKLSAMEAYFFGIIGASLECGLSLVFLYYVIMQLHFTFGDGLL